MDLPKAEDLRALLAVARAAGVTRLHVSPDGGLYVELTPASPGERVVDEINRAAPLSPDPLDIIRRAAAADTVRPAADLLDVVANGGRFIDAGSPDPTQAS